MIEEKARELGRFIGQSKEYQELKRANDALGQDPDAVKLLKQMEQLRADAQQMIKRGEDCSQAATRLLPARADRLRTPGQETARRSSGACWSAR